MDSLSKNVSIPRVFEKIDRWGGEVMNLSQGKPDTTYTIKAIKTNDDEMKKFLFTLGCYEGEEVTIVSILSEIFVISVNDARYSIDRDLAEAILI